MDYIYAGRVCKNLIRCHFYINLPIWFARAYRLSVAELEHSIFYSLVAGASHYVRIALRCSEDDGKSLSHSMGG